MFPSFLVRLILGNGKRRISTEDQLEEAERDRKELALLTEEQQNTAEKDGPVDPSALEGAVDPRVAQVLRMKGGPGVEVGGVHKAAWANRRVDVNAILADESYALRMLYEATGGDDWQRREGWDELLNNLKYPGLDWIPLQKLRAMDPIADLTHHREGVEGVKARHDVANFNLDLLSLDEASVYTRVVELRLSSCNLVGTFPEELKNLTQLRVLVMAENCLSGRLPEYLGSVLTELQDIRLHYNNFTGPLPRSLGCKYYCNLLHLWLFDNQLDGRIGDVLGNLSTLQSLKLHNNGFKGSLPLTMKQMTGLRELNLHNNAFSGILPPGLTDLCNLRELTLWNNHFQVLSTGFERMAVLQISRLAGWLAG